MMSLSQDKNQPDSQKREIGEESKSPSYIVISLDFELRWGMYDKLGLDVDRYRENLENVTEIVPAILKILTSRNLQATKVMNLVKRPGEMSLEHSVVRNALFTIVGLRLKKLPTKNIDTQFLLPEGIARSFL